MKPRERILLISFSVLLLLIVGGGLTMFLVRTYRGITDETQLLRRRLEDSNRVIADGSEWQRRHEWVKKHLPAFKSSQEASASLIGDDSDESAQAVNLTIGAKEFVTPKKAATDKEPSQFDRVTVKVTLPEVDEKVLFSWMHALQQPQAFMGVSRLQMSPSGKGKSVKCEVEITQLYEEADPTALTSVK